MRTICILSTYFTYYEFFDAYVDDHLISVEHERELFTKIKFQ